ncbi:MAG: helix-turn-helix domain-containing protein [Flavobacteriales bacterium]
MDSLVNQRIRHARIQRGMSQQEAANALNITKQMVSKYETSTVPSSDKLIKLARLYRTRVDYFFSKPEVELGEINFRKKSSFSAKSLNALKESVRLQIENYLYVENLLHIEPSFKNPLINHPVKSREDVVKAVEMLRKQWNIGNDPIHNIIEMLEDKEIKVIEIDDGSMRFDGLATVIDNKFYVVVVNKRMPIERKRFTLLHELGHLLLKLKNLEDKEVEKYCNWFSSEMLISSANLRAELGAHRSSVTVEELKNLQEKYGVSIQAIVYKMKDIGLLPENQLKVFYQRLNANSVFKAEIDQERFKGSEYSNRFNSLVHHALAEEVISTSKASALLGVPLSHLKDSLLTIKTR